MQKFGGRSPLAFHLNADLSGGGMKPTAALPMTDFAIQTRRIGARDLKDAEIRRIAVILDKRWSKMEKDASVEKYVKELEWMRDNGHTPVFVAEIDGVIGAALIAQRISEVPGEYSQLIGVDEQDGKIMVCRRITTDPDDIRFAKAPRMLITGEALSYAKELYESGELSELIAYSRFANYGEYLQAHPRVTPNIYLFTTYEKDGRTEAQVQMAAAYPIWLASQWGVQANLALYLEKTGRRHVDGTIGMHLKFGATVHRLMPGACPDDDRAGGFAVLMGYTHFLTGKEPKDSAFLPDIR